MCGPSGTGKSHLLEALGYAAIEAGHHVSWFSLEDLGALLHRHRADGTMARAVRRLMSAELIIIDDIGLLPVAAETAEALYRVVDAAYEQRSLAISSNLHPSGFDELMPKTIANSTVDRLMHHAHLVLTSGDSIRLTDATRGKGVKPLTNSRADLLAALGSSSGHGWAVLLAITGQNLLAIDSGTGGSVGTGTLQSSPRTRRQRKQSSPNRRNGSARSLEGSTCQEPVRSLRSGAGSAD